MFISKLQLFQVSFSFVHPQLLHVMLLMFITCWGYIFTGGVDYEVGPYLVDITEGNINASICINIINNDAHQTMNRAFILQINRDSLPLGIVTKDPAAAFVTILDDECKRIEIVLMYSLLFVYDLIMGLYCFDGDDKITILHICICIHENDQWPTVIFITLHVSLCMYVHAYNPFKNISIQFML